MALYYGRVPTGPLGVHSTRGAVSQCALVMAAAAALTPEGVLTETSQLRRRHDDLTAECNAVRTKLAALVDRTNGFVPTTSLDADKDEDAAEVAALEAELAEVEGSIDVAKHDRRTYELMIDRLLSEEKTYRRDLGELDKHAQVKHSDAGQLQLMVKDATDVRDAARAELAREDEALTEEVRQLSAKLADRNARLAARRHSAAEHAARVAERVRALEREKAEANARREKVVAVGSLEVEREHIAKLQGVFDSIAEVIGVSEAPLIVSKFRGQEETYHLLANLHRTSRAKIEKLTSERDAKRAAILKLRYTANASAPPATPSVVKPVGSGAQAALELAKLEEAQQREQRAARLQAARAKRIDATILQCQAALTHVSAALRAGTGPIHPHFGGGGEDGGEGGGGGGEGGEGGGGGGGGEHDGARGGGGDALDSIFAVLRPGANVPMPAQSGPLKVNDLPAAQMAVATAAALLPVDSLRSSPQRSPAHLARQATADVALAAFTGGASPLKRTKTSSSSFKATDGAAVGSPGGASSGGRADSFSPFDLGGSMGRSGSSSRGGKRSTSGLSLRSVDALASGCEEVIALLNELISEERAPTPTVAPPSPSRLSGGGGGGGGGGGLAASGSVAASVEGVSAEAGCGRGMGLVLQDGIESVEALGTYLIGYGGARAARTSCRTRPAAHALCRARALPRTRPAAYRESSGAMVMGGARGERAG